MRPDDIPAVARDSILGRIAGSRGHCGQLYQYAAVSVGLKPVLDDWISVKRVPLFMKTCRQLGLIVETDVVFLPLERGGSHPVGSERLCTTFASGRAWEPGTEYPPEAQLHVFVGRDPNAVTEAWENGWYPVVVGGRVIEPMEPDAARLGRLFGYPACCVESFRQYNDWRRCNSYEVALVHTKGAPSALANPFGRHTPWSYIFHLPCSFDCAATQAYARELKEALTSYPEYLQQIEAFHRLVFFVMNENRIYALVGELSQDCRATYGEAFFLGGLPKEDAYGALLREGEELRIEDNLVFVFRGGKVKGIIEARSDCLGPESPAFLQSL